MLVIGVVLTASAIVAMRPTVNADLRGFPGSSWDVYAPMQTSVLHAGVLLSGLALIGISAARLRSRRNPK
jgi:hypothetical protein